MKERGALLLQAIWSFVFPRQGFDKEFEDVIDLLAHLDLVSSHRARVW
jgi:hypothetical protein